MNWWDYYLSNGDRKAKPDSTPLDRSRPARGGKRSHRHGGAYFPFPYALPTAEYKALADALSALSKLQSQALQASAYGLMDATEAGI